MKVSNELTVQNDLIYKDREFLYQLHAENK